MAASNQVSVKLSPAAYELLERFSSEECVEASAILDASLRMYAERAEAFRSMEAAMERSHQAAVLNGTSEMTMDEINAEIAIAHAEKRLLDKRS